MVLSHFKGLACVLVADFRMPGVPYISFCRLICFYELQISSNRNT